jgi:hypothetical protein
MTVGTSRKQPNGCSATGALALGPDHQQQQNETEESDDSDAEFHFLLSQSVSSYVSIQNGATLADILRLTKCRPYIRSFFFVRRYVLASPKNLKTVCHCRRRTLAFFGHRFLKNNVENITVYRPSHMISAL